MTARSILAAAAVLVGLTTAEAQTMVYVSGSGSATNCGSRQLPCNSLWQALSSVVDRGTIVVLDTPDSGGSILEIQKSVTILGPAATRTGDGMAIRINPGPTGFVVLDGVSVTGDWQPSEGSGFSGIVVLSGNVSLRNCSVNNAGQGVQIVPNGRGNVSVSVSNCHFTRNRLGIAIDGVGIGANQTAAAYLDNVQVEDGAFGLGAYVSGAIYLSNSRIVGNRQGLLTDQNGQIVSFGNNVVVNSANNTPTSTQPLR